MFISKELIHSKPTLTVFADASVKPHINKAGWGGWAIADGKKGIYSSGPMEFFNNSSYAELVGISGMIQHIAAIGYHTLDEHMTIQSDSLTALGWIYNFLPNAYTAQVKCSKDSVINKIASIPKYCEEYMDNIHTLVHRSPVVYLKHIKGHQRMNQKGKKNPRAYINDKCDKLAKQAAT